MRPFTYDVLAGRVVFGPGTVREVPAEIASLGGRKVLLIADGLAKSDADVIEEELGDGVVARIGEIRPHVPIEDVDAARALADEQGADTLVTVGGGSTIGLGKAIALERDVSFVAVPTTYAGSEMTPIYGMTAGEVKRTGRDPRVKPDTVVYDVELTLALAPEVTAGSTMNALAHCVEALYAEQRNPIVSLMALEGVMALERGSTAVAADPVDMVGRSDIQYGAFLAGAALGSVGMALHHRICHVLGGTFGLAHGDANAVVLPYVVAYNQASEPLVMEELAQALGGEDSWTSLRALGSALGAPQSLSELGMTEADLDRATEMVVAAGGYNPRPVEPGWIRRLLGDALEGRDPSGQ